MRILRIIGACFTSLVVLLVLFQYFFCPKFEYPKPTPFEGSELFNPYAGLDASRWVKCNFHAHVHAWGGLTNGHGDARMLHRAYDSLGYEIHALSNYQSIDTSGQHLSNYIAAYEHGYNLKKTHQLVLGAKKVTWLDYLFPQTVHNKQNILNNLQGEGVVVLNHPRLRNGYKPDDMRMLCGYEGIEVLNPSVTSTNEWDAALSAGRRAYILGNDDLHNIVKRERLGVRCTFVNGGTDTKSVMSALKTGKTFAVIIAEGQDFRNIPKPLWVKTFGDSIRIKWSQQPKEVTFTGQNGRVLATFANTSNTSYVIKKRDHYARATAKFPNGTEVFLNPVFYVASSGYVVPTAQKNESATLLYRGLGMFLGLLWLGALWKWLFKTPFIRAR